MWVLVMIILYVVGLEELEGDFYESQEEFGESN